jgi:hypothetical protein
MTARRQVYHAVYETPFTVLTGAEFAAIYTGSNLILCFELFRD